ncbi:MAG: citrate (Si)-synthase, partial [Proteobacteria bacterium]|nr:citrate (Si)-synthase [Pseudomonadota bacterium]
MVGESGAPRSNGKVTVTDASGKTSEYPVLEGSVGPRVVDIRSLYRETGLFTFDPGYMATASCESKITYIDGDEGMLMHRGYTIEDLSE